MQPTRLKLTTQTIQRLLRRNAKGRVTKVLQKLHSADIAHMLNHLRRDEAQDVFAILRSDARRAEVLSELEPNLISFLLQEMDDPRVVKLLSELPSDDVAQVLNAIDDARTERLLEEMSSQDQGHVEELLNYEEETAGRIMVQNFFALHEDTTVNDCIKRLQGAGDFEMVFYIYVVDDAGKLTGVLSLRKLLLVNPESSLKEFATRSLITVRPYEDQEEVARLVERYNLLAVPVVDDNGRMLGIVTVDDVIDVIKEEATEDIYRMVGSEQAHIALDSPVEAFRVRFPWLLLRVLGGIAAALIISRFESIQGRMFMLVAMLPLLLGLGSSSGIQTAITTTRGLTLGVVEGHMFFKIIWRELLSALLFTLTFGVIIGFVGAVMFHSISFALFTMIACCLVTLASSVCGTGIPLLLKRLHLDPTTSIMPLVSTSVDLLLIVFYFGLARLLVLKHLF